MKQPAPQYLIEQAQLLSRQLAFDYVSAALSWIAFHKLSPDCYRIPFGDVLLRYLCWKELDEHGEDACIGAFWEELLEEHGFESDRQWRMRQKKYLPTARELATSGPYAPQIRPPNGKESWRGKPLVEVMHEPEFYFIDPPVPMLPAFETEEDRRERPDLYGPIALPKSALRNALNEKAVIKDSRKAVESAEPKQCLMPKDWPKDYDPNTTPGSLEITPEDRARYPRLFPPEKEKLTGISHWNPREWDGSLDLSSLIRGMTEAEYRAKHPLLYPDEQRITPLSDESTRAFLGERSERNRPGAGREYASQSEDDEPGWKKSENGLWLRENCLEKTEWDPGGWQGTPELDRLRREMTELQSPETEPVLEPRKYATEDEVKCALQHAERVLAKHKEGLNTPYPAIQRVRELAQRRHAQKTEEAQRASQREVAQLARVDKAIEEFEKWEPPKASRRM